MPSFSRRRNSSRVHSPAFTLVEVLITLAVLLVILVTLLRFVTDVDTAWKSAAGDPFAEAQDAFETVVRNLAAATLAPYQDYADSTGAFRTSSATFVPDHPARRSDLDFVCGPGLLAASGRTTTGSAVFFLAPQGYTQTYAHLGMERLLNAVGYFVEFGDDDSAPGFILPQTHFWRWRLKQFLQPSESLQIFAMTPLVTWPSSAWIQQAVPSGASVPVLAENIVTLIILPEPAATDTGTTLIPNYSYDSRNAGNRLTLHQLPPRLWVVLVAMDAASAQRLAAQNGSNPPALVPAALFQQPSQLAPDLASLDGLLTAQKIGHRIFQREILLPSSAWSDTPSP